MSLAFCLIFFLFCWKTDGNGGSGKSSVRRKNNTNCVMINGSKSGAANNLNIIKEPIVIPPTPPPERDMDDEGSFSVCSDNEGEEDLEEEADEYQPMRPVSD